MKVKARDIDTLMSVIAVIFVVAVFLLTGKDVRDTLLVGCFVAAPTKFIAIARMLDIMRNPENKNL